MSYKINFDNSYAHLPERFYQKISPTPVRNPSLIKFNYALAAELNLPELDEETIVKIFSGNQIPDGAEPLAQAYAGHQFGHFVPQLGDGRAILLAELIDRNGQRKDIQLKGSGPTAFSRRGDGRAWLGPVIREYLVSEAMYHLGVPTTRSLAAIATGEEIYRQTKLPGAVLTRVASSHIRVGTFEYFFARQDFEAVKLLADYVIERHYPDVKASDSQYLELFRHIGIKQGSLICKWLSIGFVHGVMNTDNTSIAGETIDYGPCAFMDFYHPNTVFSSIDHQGRYAYQNQYDICLWNLSSLANCLLFLIDADQEQAVGQCKRVFSELKNQFDLEYKSIFVAKIGLQSQSERAFELVQELLDLMKNYRADFTLVFRYLAKLLAEEIQELDFFTLFDDIDDSRLRVLDWLGRWRQSIVKESSEPKEIAAQMNKINPAYIPRNHLIEEAINQAHQYNDFSKMNDLLELFSDPYIERDIFKDFMQAPLNKSSDYVTFCGT